jgi:hypothetical protein
VVHCMSPPRGRILIRFPTVNAQSNGPVHCTGLPVDELPNTVARIRCPIDLRRQMLPLETIAVIMGGGSALRRGGNKVGGNQLHAALRTPGGH